MKNKFALGLIGLAVWLNGGSVYAQSTEKLFFGGVSLMHGVGSYNGLNVGGGVFGRVHYPLAKKVAFTAKLGAEVYRVADYSSIPYSYLGYGYNAITGFGFNTIYYNWNSYEYKTWGVSVPFNFGPRLYLTPNVYASLNVGFDAAISRALLTSFHAEPAIGYVRSLGNGAWLDVSGGYFTSFSRGSGVFGLSAAYGVPFNLK